MSQEMIETSREFLDDFFSEEDEDQKKMSVKKEYKNNMNDVLSIDKNDYHMSIEETTVNGKSIESNQNEDISDGQVGRNESSKLNQNCNSDGNRKKNARKHRNDSSVTGNKNDNSDGNGNKKRKMTPKKNNVIKTDEDVHLKFLIPGSAAGGIIGRGGENIGKIQKSCNVKVTVSKSNEVFQNTNERVCFISGQIPDILQAYKKVNDSMAKCNATEISRISEIKFLIPNSTAGYLIGKSGRYIKIIKEESGAFIKCSQHQNGQCERIVIIEGPEEKRLKALKLSIEKCVEDPQINCMMSVSSTRSKLDNGQFDDSDSYQNNNNGSLNFLNLGSSQLGSGLGNTSSAVSNLLQVMNESGGSFQMTSQSLKETLIRRGFNSNSEAIHEIISAVEILLRYGLISKIPTSNSNPLIGNIAGLVSLMGVGPRNALNSNFNSLGNNCNNRMGIDFSEISGKKFNNQRKMPELVSNFNNSPSMQKDDSNNFNILKIIQETLCNQNRF